MSESSTFLTMLFSHSIPKKGVLYILCPPLVISYFEVPLYHFSLIPHLVTYKPHIDFLLPSVVSCVAQSPSLFSSSPTLRQLPWDYLHTSFPTSQVLQLQWLPFFENCLLAWFDSHLIRTALPACAQVLKFPSLTTASCLFPLLCHHSSLTCLLSSCFCFFFFSVLSQTSLNFPLLNIGNALVEEMECTKFCAMQTFISQGIIGLGTIIILILQIKILWLRDEV